ncbi:separin [Scyliorhinus torazame]|uniref:separin n=1 Tax=Scyliorhinus torazame TaxID=75743 RepID=UPI003B5A85AB
MDRISVRCDQDGQRLCNGLCGGGPEAAGLRARDPGNRHQLLDDRAHAFLWQYICDVESRVRASTEGVSSGGAEAGAELDDGSTNDLDYEDKKQGALSVHDCINFNLTAETQRCRGLDKALSLWKSLLSQTAAPRLRSSEQTLHALHLTAALYGLLDKPFQVIESYGLTLRLLEAEEADPLSVAGVLLQLGETLLLVDCLDQAEVCLDEAEVLLKTLDPGRGDQLLMMTLSLLRSRLLLSRHQVPGGLALLLDVLACPALQKPSKVWYLLKAKAQQVVACYLGLPPSALPLPLRRSLQERGWSSPEAALTDSHKLLCGIVMLLCPGVLTFGKSSPELRCPGTAGDSLFQKWLVLTNLLTCSQSLVSLLTAVGSTQEAKMFCLETLRLTAKLQCVRP